MSDSAPAVQPPSEKPISPPVKKGDKKFWLMIVAIIVAIALISTTAYVLLLPKDEKLIELTLASEMDPSGTITIDAGRPVDLSVTSVLANEDEDISFDADTWTNVTYRWSRSPITLGSFDLLAKRTVTFTAGDAANSGTITCNITFDDSVRESQMVTLTASIVVSPPYLDSIAVTPSVKTLSSDEPWPFTATAMDSVGGTMTGVTFAWSVTNFSDEEHDLSAMTGSTVTFTGFVEGNASLNATATVGGISKTGSALIQIGGPAERSVDYYWYDMFDVPLGEWWDFRWEVYGTEEPLTDEYPYLFKWYGKEDGNFWTYTNMRLDITGRNMPELNMNENPEFLPYLGSSRGGTAIIDWYMQYLTADEMSAFPDATSAWLDGWVIALNGTTTLDQQAAMSVLGITSEELGNFASWWTANNASVNADYSDWMKYEAGRYRLDIYPMYEYPFTPLTFKIWAEEVGNSIVLNYNLVTWGMEALMTRWMHEAFMETEWYFEDMDFHAVIGPEDADLDVSTAVEYAMYAYETTLESEPCWMWEALVQDYVESSLAHPVSDYDLYADKEYLMLSPGSPLYGDMMTYDYAPGAWNLTEGETISIEWPSDDQLFLRHGGDYIVYEEYGSMRCDYSEPMWTDFSDLISVDTAERVLTFEGPLDVWTWSKDQTVDENLASEWDRLGILPYGMPTIEFRMAGPPMASSFDVEPSTLDVEGGTPLSVTVTVKDQYGEVYPGYAGTIGFESTDELATLPSDYEFVVGDAGVRLFTDAVVFNTEGVQTITARDSVDSSLFGVSDDISVAEPPMPTSLLIEGVTNPILKGNSSNFTVTVLDQFGDLYPGYTGEIEFSSNDSSAVFTPATYTFVPGDSGVAPFTYGVVFNTGGVHDLTAVDTSDPSISDSLLGIVVLQLKLVVSYDPVDVIANETAVDVTVEVFDQYDDPFIEYIGTVELTSTDGLIYMPELSHEFDLADEGVYTFSDIVMGMPGTQTITATDANDATITGSVDVDVSEEAVASSFRLTDLPPTCRVGTPYDLTVTVLDQYDRVYPDYLGTVDFDTNRSGEVTLPSSYEFLVADAGVHQFVDGVTFTAVNTFSIYCTDSIDSSITGSVDDIYATDVDIVISKFTVEGITDMWNGNTSDVTVTAYDQFDNVFTIYEGTIHFMVDPDVGTISLPADYKFLLADEGIHTFPAAVSFSDPDTYNVSVQDTVVTSANGWQDDIVISQGPYAARLEISGAPSSVPSGTSFTVTVTVYDQWDNVFEDYDGTVVFSSDDTAATLPDPYPFELVDAGEHEFTDELILVTEGDQTITVEDSVDAALTDTVAVTVTEAVVRSMAFTVYDMLAEPWGEWWDAPTWGRETMYQDSFVINRGEYNTMLYLPGYDAKIDKVVRTQGIIMAPYRMSMEGQNLPELDASNPVFMPTLGSGSSTGAAVQLDLYFQYLSTDWWADYWVTEWGDNANWPGDSAFPMTSSDGYDVGTNMTVTMNREAALLWMGIPNDSTNPLTWWTANKATYKTAWETWLSNQGNVVYDIYCGFEWTMDFRFAPSNPSMMDLSVDGDGNVVLKIGVITWGYEVLMCRWLDAAGLMTHQPWYEDFSMSVTYGETMSNLVSDAVCQYSMHAVKANGTTEDPAWVWESVRIDYIGSFGAHLISDYDDYVALYYQTWNAGDSRFGYDAMYDTAPGIFDLNDGEQLIFQLSTESDVIGYLGKHTPNYDDDYLDVMYSDDPSGFEAIQQDGSMELGYYITNPADPLDLMSMYNPTTKTLTIDGDSSYDFDNVHWGTGALYHGAPWIEFNIVTPKAAVASVPMTEVVESEPVAVSGSSGAAELLSLCAVVSASMIAIAALGCNVRRIENA